MKTEPTQTDASPSNMHIVIEWDLASVDSWYSIYDQIARTNLVQSYAYAKTMRKRHAMQTRFGVIKDADTMRVLGLVQVQVFKLAFYLRIRIDRGPLWLTPVSDEQRADFWRQMNRIYPKKFGTRRHVLPEAVENRQNLQMMSDAGFERKADGYQTIWLDLGCGLDTLRSKMKKSWRNALSKAERSGLKIYADPDAKNLEHLLFHYTKDRAGKGYAGPSPKFIRAMESFKGSADHSIIFSAENNGKPCAEIYIWCHGPAATYQIGWSNSDGRDTNAHYLLLWQAVSYLKHAGVKSLDLGGLNPDGAEGVTRFKSGIGGEVFKTVGRYI